MEYENKNYVVQSNDFIRTANNDLKTTPLKLFKMFVSYINTDFPPEDGKVSVPKQDLVLCFNGEKNNYSHLKENVRALQRTSIEVKPVGGKQHYVSLVTDLYWEEDSPIVTVTFHKDVMPYLIRLKNLFLKYPASNIPQFKTKYGLILYENLLSYRRQYNTFEHTYELDELRWITGTTKKYPVFGHLEEKVIKKGVDDINNANVEILVKYKKIKSGRNIRSIRFLMADRQSYKDKTYDDAVRHSTLQPKEHKELNDQNKAIGWNQFYAIFKEIDTESKFTETQVMDLFKKYQQSPVSDVRKWIMERVELFY